MTRTGPARVRAIVAKQRAKVPAVVVTGTPTASVAALDALEELIAIGREVDAAHKRERGSGT